MRARRNLLGFGALLILHFLVDECSSLNLEGSALMGFRLKVEVDPYGIFANWDPRDSHPCNWSGVHCVNGKVEMLNLKKMYLGGILAPELGKLSHLRSLVLYKNNFSGVIPKEIGGLTMLEHLDLRGNNLSGTIPMEIWEMLSLKRLLLCDNKFQGTSSWIEKSNMLSVLKCDRNLSCDVAATEIGFLNRKVRHCFWQSGLQQLKKANSLLLPLKGKFMHLFDLMPLFSFEREYPDNTEEKHGENLLAGVDSARRRLFEANSNLPASPVSSTPPGDVIVPSIGSGSFSAVNSNQQSPVSKLPPPDPPQNSPTSSPTKPTNSVNEQSSKRLGMLIYVLVFGVAVLLVIVAIMLCMCRSNGGPAIGPWKTGLSGQLQKAFVTGVPKLNRSELEAACEDFSNIISTTSDYTIFKGTLSSGVEIAVFSSAVPSTKEWSKRSEMCFRKKIDTISQVKHKNFINLLGYCLEDEPFMRMMVFEYAPNGTLSDHLHIKEFDHLDWTARVRIIMGIAYCLQHMHHELHPPIAHPDLHSSSIFITDDYSAKIADTSIWKEVVAKGKIAGDEEMEHSQLPCAVPEGDVYNFGILLIEIISGKVPYSEEQGSILSWAAGYLNDKRFGSLTDPSLKFVKDTELEVICEVIQDCILRDPKKRPTMKEATMKLREVISISPEAATPRLSPLWWAELEILSVEAS